MVAGRKGNAMLVKVLIPQSSAQPGVSWRRPATLFAGSRGNVNLSELRRLALPLLLVTSYLLSSVGRAALDSAPNFVFVMADDLGWADIDFHGGTAPAPRLSQLRDESVELTQHYVAPVCSPTRVGLLTGRCWSRFGVTTPTNTLALPPATDTLATVLRSNGYDTCLIGKWHLGSLPKWGPNHFGFAHSYGSLAGGVSPWNHRYKKGPYSHTWHRNGQLVEEQGHVTDLLTDEAVRWVESRQAKRPFLLYLPYTAIHLPLKEPQEWVDRVPQDITGDVARHYAASIMHLDHSVGRVLDALERTGAAQNTLFVFTSDNGGSTAENNDLKYPDDNCPNGRLPGNNRPFRGQKGTVYEGGIRVPTIVRWPGRIEPGVSDIPVQITDWMPTFCSLAGGSVRVDLKWDGVDLTDLLTKGHPPADRAIYTAGPGHRAVALRTGDFKLVVHGRADVKKTELFDLSSDPEESTNIAAEQPDQLKNMETLLARISAADNDAVAEQPRPVDSLITATTVQTLWQNRDGKSKTWFHPRACMLPDQDGKPFALMTLQEIGGSDYFGPVHRSVSTDRGRTWSNPEPIAAFGRESVPNRTDGLQAAVCDVTPQYHPASDTVLALGHVVFYKGGYFARNEQLARYPVYAVRNSDGDWSERKMLAWDDPRRTFIYTNNCGQRVVLPNGDIQMSLTFGSRPENRMVAGVRCSFDGQELAIKQVGSELHNAVGRGLLEPSVTQFRNEFWMTIRAEDQRGYVSVSKDGLEWSAKQPWCWDDGSPLTMSTTQQHWVTHSDGLFLVYTRRDDTNQNVIRWRSPLWVAQVDTRSRRLIKASERILIPLVGDGINDPDKVALMGNFNVTNVSAEESWVTAGEWMPRNGYRGNVLLARIYWARPNRTPIW